jgi:CRP-like cAMP-binding protein
MNTGLLDQLQGLSTGQRSQILALFARKEYGPEEYIFFEGDVPCRLWFVEEGRVRLLKHSDMGKDVIVTVVSTGSFLGELAVREGVPCPVTAQAIGPTVMLTLQADAYLELLHRYPELAVFIIESLGRRLNEAYDTIRSLAVERVERRIARLLLKLANSVGQAAGASILIDMPLTRQDIAEMTGTTVESAIRVMSKFRKQGLIASRSGKLYLNEPHSLVVIADELYKSDGGSASED